MDQLDRLRTFVAVAEHASFAQAARRLRLSPAAASHAVANLEKSLGVTLLRRTTRSVALTEHGTAYLLRCRHALDELDAAASELRGADAQPRGSLVVTAPVLFGRLHVLPVIAQMLRDHPGVDIRLVLVDRVVRVVEEGIDVAIRIAELADSGLHAVRVADVRRVLVASPSYLEARGVPGDPADLTGHDVIAFEGTSPNNEWRFNASGKPAVRFTPRMVVNDAGTAIEACAAGLGITRVLSYQVAAHIAAGTLEPVLAQQSPPSVPVSLVYPTNRRRAPNVMAFIALARKHFDQHPVN